MMSMGTGKNCMMNMGTDMNCKNMETSTSTSYKDTKKSMGKENFCNKDSMNKCMDNRSNLSNANKDSYKYFLDTRAIHQEEPYDFFLILIMLIQPKFLLS